jgi:hypothetical protein
MPVDVQRYQAHLPASIEVQGRTYLRGSLLGSGGHAVVAHYRSREPGAAPDLAVRISGCGKSQDEDLQLAMAREADAAIRDCAARAGISRPLRLPLLERHEGDCHLQALLYATTNLQEWACQNPRRTAKQVRDIFRQVYAIVLCLRDAGYSYSDIKPSNFMVLRDDRTDELAVTVADLSGLDRPGASSITLTPSLLPPDMLRGVAWSQLDVVQSFLLGGVLLTLLLGCDAEQRRSGALGEFYACLRAPKAPEACLRDVMGRLHTSLPDNLPLRRPEVRDLAALMLVLLGFGGRFVPLQQLRTLPVLSPPASVAAAPT